jgi:hypothetical protein
VQHVAVSVLAGSFEVGQTCQEPSDLAHGEGSVFVVGFTGSPFAAAVAVSTARKAWASIERVVSWQGRQRDDSVCQYPRGHWYQSIRRRRGRCPSDCSKEGAVNVTKHGFILKTWIDDLDALAARLVSLANPADRIAPNLAGVRSWTATSTLDLSQVQRSRPIAVRQVMRRRRAKLSAFCVGLRLDQRGCSFPQSTAKIRSDQQTMTPFYKVTAISLRISPGQS